jgi:hypothetical protein
MDTKRFDDLSRTLAAGSSRRQVLRAGASTLLAAPLAALGLSRGSEQASARHKRCRTVGLKQPCGSNSQCCPSKTGTICSSNFCRSDDLTVCCKPAGGSCLFDCDCCGQFSRCSGAGVCE